MVNVDSINHVPDGGVQFPGQEMGNQNEEPSDIPQDGGVRRGKKNRIPQEIYVLEMCDRTYEKGKYEGVGLPAVKESQLRGGG